MEELKIKFNSLIFDVIVILLIQFIMCLLIMYDNTTTNNRLYEHKERLNEQKRLLIAQQTQINQLILNAEYNKLRYEKKVR